MAGLEFGSDAGAFFTMLGSTPGFGLITPPAAPGADWANVAPH
jgi:hypothetical protein